MILKSEIFLFEQKTKIHYGKFGSGDIPVVLLHGFGASMNTWEEIFDKFSTEKFTLYFIDLKGFGLSSKEPEGDYSFKAQSDIVLAFLNEKNLKNVILIGHSYGGGVALLTTINSGKYFHQISKLVLIDTASYKDDLPLFVKYLTTPCLNSLILSFSSYTFSARIALSRLFYDKKKVNKAAIDRYAFSMSQKGTRHSFIQAAKQIIPENYDELIGLFSDIRIPTLIIWGRQDTVIPLRNGIRLNNDIKTSKLCIVENCGHIPQEERPEETYACINEFITI